MPAHGLALVLKILEIVQNGLGWTEMDSKQVTNRWSKDALFRWFDGQEMKSWGLQGTFR